MASASRRPRAPTPSPAAWPMAPTSAASPGGSPTAPASSATSPTNSPAEPPGGSPRERWQYCGESALEEGERQDAKAPAEGDGTTLLIFPLLIPLLVPSFKRATSKWMRRPSVRPVAFRYARNLRGVHGRERRRRPWRSWRLDDPSPSVGRCRLEVAPWGSPAFPRGVLAPRGLTGGG